jgi:hypothetical protein
MIRLNLVVVGLFGLLLVPGAPSSFFDGLPLSRPGEFLGLACLLPYLVSAALRHSVGEWAVRAARPALNLGPWLLAGAACVKLALLVAEGPPGFKACYSSLVDGPGRCEMSWEDPFRRFNGTRIDRTINFGPVGLNTGDLVKPPYLTGALRAGVSETNWHLSFLNSLRLNLYQVPGDGVTERLPFDVTWQGFVALSPGDKIRVTFVGQGRIDLCDQSFVLPPSYDGPAVATLAVPSGRCPFRLHYRFDNGYRRGGEPPPAGHYAAARVERVPGVEAFDPRPLEPAAPGLRWRLLAVLGDVIVGFALGALAVVGLVVTGGWYHVPGVLAGVVVLLGLAPMGPVAIASASAALCGVLWLGLAHAPRFRSATLVYGAVLSWVMVRTLCAYPGTHAVLYRRAGADWLTYESFARSILEAGSLMGGEPVFYYQPGFRYWVFLSRIIFGDNDVALSIAATTLVIWGVFAAGLRSLADHPARARPATVAVGTLALTLVNSDFVVRCIRIGVSEYPTWALFPVAGALALSRPSVRSVAMSGCLLGASFVLRTAQAPGLAWLAGVAIARGYRTCRHMGKWLLVPGLLIASLPLLHNRIYGHQWVWLPTSKAIPQVIAVPLGEYAGERSLGDKVAVALDQIRRILYASPQEPRSWDLGVVFLGLQLLWAISLIRQCRGTPRFSAALWILALPLFFFAPYLSYSVSPFYPRHLIVGYLAAAFAVVWSEGLHCQIRHDPSSPGIPEEVPIDGSSTSISRLT